MHKKITVFVAIILLLAFAAGCAAGLDIPSANEDIGDPAEPIEGNTEEPNEEQDETKEPGEAPAEEPDDKGNEEDPEKQPSGEEQPEENRQPDSSVVYISASRLNVREEPSSSSAKKDSLMKGAAVRVLGEATDEKSAKWLHIAYDSLGKEVTGWIAAEYTVADRLELLPDFLRNLDYSPIEKVEYPNNPRVKARGIYVTIYSAGGSRLDKLIEMAKRTEINTFVIDVKDDKGYMLFETEAAKKYAPKANNYRTVKDIQSFMKKLKDNGIYAIARIVSFKDPIYAEAHPDRAIVYKDTGKVFTNSDNLAWVSAYDRQLWEYNLAVAKEAAAVGFNEIQFDYVRFPASNGGKLDAKLDYRNKENMSKPQAIQEFLKYAREQLSPLQVYISADVYGLVGSVADDMALGQYWEAVSNVVDYISPMMYPSHYADGTYGLPVPDAYPYETVFNSAKDSVARNRNIQTPAIIRPWIQDFSATSWVKGAIPYGEKEVRAQIRALKENGIEEYLLWDAANTYTEEALTGNFDE